jgi:hypothetical protein
LKKCVAAVLVMTFGSLCAAAPATADQGEMPFAPPQETLAAPAAAPETQPKGDMDPIWVGAMSAILPCTGQWYNGELWTWKSGAMAAIEAGSIFVLAFFAAGGAGDDAKMVCMAGAGGMIANHAWSGWDAWNVAKKNKGLAFNADQARQRVMVSYNVPF